MEATPGDVMNDVWSRNGAVRVNEDGLFRKAIDVWVALAADSTVPTRVLNDVVNGATAWSGVHRSGATTYDLNVYAGLGPAPATLDVRLWDSNLTQLRGRPAPSGASAEVCGSGMYVRDIVSNRSLYTHEFGHNLGLDHFGNMGNGMMSNSLNRSIQGWEVESLVNLYQN